MSKHNIVVLDLETAHSADDCKHCGTAFDSGQHTLAPGHGFEKIGWDDKLALGLSIGCYYDYRDSRVHWFDVYTLAATVRHIVETQPLLVSFNGINFDFMLMREILHQCAEASHSTPLACLCDAFLVLYTSSYDILAEIWQVDPGRKFERGLNSLDAIAQANGYGAKLSHGAQAPKDWREGQYAKVLNYCQDDVIKTCQLFEQIVEIGVIKRGDSMSIALPAPLWPSGHVVELPGQR